MKRLSLLAVSLVIMVNCTSAQNSQNIDYSALINEYSELLKTEMPANNIVGLSISRTANEITVWQHKFNYHTVNSYAPFRVSVGYAGCKFRQ